MAGCTGSDPIVTETPVPSASGSAEPQPSATPSVSVSVSPSVAALSDEELLEILPAGAEFPDVEGAVVTAQFFSVLLGEIFKSGDTTVWEALATDACDYCGSQVEAIEKFRDSGRTARGGSVALDETKTRGALGDDGFAYVRTDVQIADLFASSAGQPEENVEPEAHVQLDLQMLLVGEVWKVNGVQAETLP